MSALNQYKIVSRNLINGADGDVTIRKIVTSSLSIKSH